MLTNWEQHGERFYSTYEGKEFCVRELKDGTWGFFGKYIGDTTWELERVYPGAEEAMEA